MMQQSSEQDSRPQPQIKGVDSFCRDEAGISPSIRLKHIDESKRGRVKRYKPRQGRAKENESESLSDIDDAEVIGYLNTKVEKNYKRILWEAMNGKYKAAKKQKQTIDKNKGASVKKAIKNARKVEIQRPSSRINYDVLKALDDKWNTDSEGDQLSRTELDNVRTNGSPNRNIIPEMQGYDEDQQYIGKDYETSGDYTDHMHSEEYADENFDDGYFDF